MKNMAHRWLPNINKFFFSSGRFMEICDSQLHSVSHDQSEFLARRLDEYARTLSIIVTRFNEILWPPWITENMLAQSIVSFGTYRFTLIALWTRISSSRQKRSNGVFSVILVENSGVHGWPRFCLGQGEAGNFTQRLWYAMEWHCTNPWCIRKNSSPQMTPIRYVSRKEGVV